MKPLDPRLLRSGRATRGYLLASGAIGVAVAACLAAQALLLSHVVARAFLGGAGLSALHPALLALFAVVALRALLAWAGQVVAHLAAARVKSELRSRLLARTLELGPAFLGRERSGELATTAVSGIDALEGYFGRYLPAFVQAALVPALLLAVVLPTDRLSALLMACTIPLVPVFMVLIGQAGEHRTERQWRTLSLLGAHFLDIVQGLPTLKIFGRGHAQRATIREVTDAYRRATMGVLRTTFLSALVLELLATLGVALVAVSIGVRLVDGTMTFQAGLAVLLLAPEVYLPLRQVGARFHASAEGLAAADRVFQVLDAADPAPATHAPATAGDQPDAEIRFEDVSFEYPGRSGAVLDRASFVVHTGERVALVGPSGAGKSTVAMLLLGMACPCAGRITVGGLDLAGADPAAWRARVGWLPQRPYLFHGTITDNIRLADPSAGGAAVRRAARLAGADGFIDALPRRFDTQVGERGVLLSAGQRQRIALARAFLANRPLLVLDEPTANLDPESEAVVRQALERLEAGRTVLVIAHRAALAGAVERVLAVRDGSVIEAGRPPGDQPVGNGTNRPAGLGHISSGSGVHHAPEASPPGSFAVRPTPPEGSADDGCTSLGEALGLLRRITRLGAGHRGRITLAVLSGLATVGCGIGLAATSGYLIAAAALQPPILELQIAIAGVRGFGIGRGVFRYAERLASHDLAFRFLAGLRVRFYEGLERLAPGGLDGWRSGDLLGRVVSDVDGLQDLYLRVLAPPLVALLASGLAVGIAAGILPAAAGVLVASLLAAGVAVPLLGAALGRASGRRLASARGTLSAEVVELLQGMPELLAWGRAGDRLRRVLTVDASLERHERRSAWRTGLVDGLAALLPGLAALGMLLTGIPAVRAGRLDGIRLTVLVLLALASFEATAPLPAAFEQLAGHLAAARRLFAIADAPAPVRDPSEPAPAPAGRAIVLEGARVRFHSGGPPTFDGLDLCLEPGRRVALVGRSGAGKTTVAMVLLRFRELDGGRAVLDGRDLSAYAAADVRRVIGLAAQDAHLFNTSIRENLRLARPDVDQDALEAAAAKGRILDWIGSLPDGWDTLVGEQGVQVSGGQRQRIALTRVLLAGFPIVVLDEPTANLDPATECALLDDLLDATTGQATLLITHRLTGLDRVDEVLVLDEGLVVERGTHAELLARGGRYHHMWAVERDEPAVRSLAPVRAPTAAQR